MNQGLPYPVGHGGVCPECGSIDITHDPVSGHHVCEGCFNAWVLPKAIDPGQAKQLAREYIDSEMTGFAYPVVELDDDGKLTCFDYERVD